jgi:hypothetical protein
VIYLVLITGALAAIVAGAAAWPAVRNARKARHARPAGHGEDGAGAGGAPRPESLEGVLVSQLVRGEISRRQYRLAMAGVADRDADRHPMSVPPDAVPPEA